VLTDGDCRVGSEWLKSIAAEVTGNPAQMISGPVTFYREDSFFQKMQTVEFASLIGSGAATLQLGLPTMCNAANLAFSKSAFQDVNGYAGTAHTATGDDLFLMHKIHTRFPGCVRFLKKRESIVYTRAKADWPSFYQQRKRWASKWNLYQDRRVTRLAILVFLSNVALLAGITGYFLDALTWQALLVGMVLRFASEFLFLGSVLLFLKKPAMLRWIFPVQMVYFLYVTFFAIIAQKRGYVWKGRKLH
jgi:cellulose synthase/poly-beta-1,6-N-acetylglucosamine synthase-like glycosyltransferase